MPSYSLEQILAPQVILERISQIQLPGTTLSQMFGWNVGAGPVNGAMMTGNDGEGFNQQGGNHRDYGLRTGQYDIFNNTRRIATGSVPGTTSTLIEPQVVGFTQFTLPRLAESMPLSYEKLQNLRPIGGPSSTNDQSGNTYITMQERYMAARVANMVEMQTAGMLRGKYYLNIEGNVLHQSLTTSGRANQIEVNYQLDAALVGSVTADGVAVGTWQTNTTDIPAQLYAINREMINRTGTGFKHVFMSSAVARNLQNNTEVQELAGTYEPFEYTRRVGNGEFTFRLKGMPWWEFHVVDYILQEYLVSTGVWTKVNVIPANTAVFIPEVDSSWTQYIRGGEEVVEGPNGRKSFQYGFYAYAYPTHNPAGYLLNTIHNGLPSLKVPECIISATVQA